MVLTEKIESEAVKQAAYLIANSARTAPKTKGIDDLKIVLVQGEELTKLAEKMKKLAYERKNPRMLRDSESLKQAEAVLLLGISGGKSLDFDCGACGFKTCENFKKTIRSEGKDFKGPNCMYKVLDLGIALGSAVKTASDLNIDNRLMVSVGIAGRQLGYLKEDIVVGIPLASKGKNPFFDRKIPEL